MSKRRSVTNVKADDRTADTDADVESHPGNAPVSAHGVAAFASPVRITFRHIRKRLADIDGLSGKAAIDGLVAAGILADDSPKQVAEIRHCQSQGDNEKTIIEIETVDTGDTLRSEEQ